MRENINETVILAIEKIAGLGDGVAEHEGQRIFVPYTVEGDVVAARITRVTADAAYAAPLEIIVPGKTRVSPPCLHFGVCGGCALQHVEAEAYIAFKHTMAKEAVRKAGYDPAIVGPVVRIAAASRRRGEWKIEKGRLGYYAHASHRLVDIAECVVLEPELFRLLMHLRPALVAEPAVVSLQMNGVDDGYDVLIDVSRAVPITVPDDPAIRRVSIRLGSRITTLRTAEAVTVTLGDVRVEVPPGIFLQAAREAQAIMMNHVAASVACAARILDLFAGIGTYSFPASGHGNVTVVESDAAMVDAVNAAAVKYARTNRVKAEVRDLFARPYLPEELQSFNAVILNPPRVGAKAQAEQLARSSVPRVTMVSCNPATFSRDARMLREGGYALSSVIPIDQFVYSPHLEMIAVFMK